MNDTEKMMATNFSGIAKMPITVSNVGGETYAFGEELGVLRIYKHYNGNGVVDFSANLNSWFFRFGK